jgi:glycosyltransferase involved in cell wall biosynthesis
MNLGWRERTRIPNTYKDFRIVRSHGRVFGIPPTVMSESLSKVKLALSHPAVLSTETMEEMLQAIDRFDANSLRPQSIGTFEDYELVRHRGAFYAVPHSAEVDLDVAEERSRTGVISGASQSDLEQKVRQAKAAVPVEFAGWLPIFEWSGNCGSHPQFTHTGSPPAGYRFVNTGPAKRRSLFKRRMKLLLRRVKRSAAAAGALARVPVAFLKPHRGVTMWARFRIFAYLVRMLAMFLAHGCRLLPSLRFLQTRHLQSQLLMGDKRGVVFLTSIPYTYGQNPWVIEIEDPTTLFYPLITNGFTSSLLIKQSPYFPIVKSLLEADHCKAIITHMRSTAQLVPQLFGSDVIRNKMIYAPLGVKLPQRWQRHEPRSDAEPIDLLFINSWCRVPANFYLRGGLDILEAFATLRERYPQLRLTLRTNLPPLHPRFHRIIESGWVRVIDRFVSANEMAELHASSDIFLLPSARIHIVSLLQAMSYGLPVVGSDGWGMEEYLTHEHNGLVVKGRYGKVSWADEETGFLREDYESMYTCNSQVVEGIVEAVSRLVEDRQLRAHLGHNARNDVETKYTLQQWNTALQSAFDVARGADSKTPLARGVPRGFIDRAVSSRSIATDVETNKTLLATDETRMKHG